MEKIVRKYKLGEEPKTDLEYWLGKTVEERIYALEILRERYILLNHNGIRPKMQRVWKILKRVNGKYTEIRRSENYPSSDTF